MSVRQRDDRGFVLVMVGLLIIPIMAFAALAVDVSSWYSRATELQRAADSASLSGVIWLPRIGVAKTNADKNLSDNGFVNGVNNIAVTQEAVSTDSDTGSAYKVCVSDNKVAQFFGGILGPPTKLTRCATAKFNLPLSMGSSGNSFGGISADATGYIPGTPATDPYGPAPTPPGNDYGIRPDNYSTATVSGMTGNYAPFNGNRYGCRAVTSGSNRGYYWNASGGRTSRTSSGSNLGNLVVASYSTGGWFGGTTYNLYAIDLPACSWSAEARDAQPAQREIREDQDPGYWASIEAPGTDAVQGDLIAPACYGLAGTVNGSSITCANNSRGGPNPRHPSDASENGYFYTIDIGASNPVVMIQVYDAAMNSGSVTNDLEWSKNSWTTHFAVYAPDGTPYDPTDNNVVASCGGGSGDTENSGSWSLNRGASFGAGTWKTLCTLTTPSVTVDHDSYILKVWSTGVGNAANNYALRAVAANSTSTDTYAYPTTALAFAQQPTLSAWTRMSINVHQLANSSDRKATFFFAKITEKYAGQRVNMTLYDSAEGSDSVTINQGSGIQMGCAYESHPLIPGKTGTNGSGGGNLIGNGQPSQKLISSSFPCRINTSGSTYNGQALTITIPIPSDYTCDASLRPPKVNDTTFSGNGCWWSVTYQGGTGQTVTDNTTWEVSIGGNPVRLVGND